MTLKKQRWRLARKMRKTTGLPLSVCFLIARRSVGRVVFDWGSVDFGDSAAGLQARDAVFRDSFQAFDPSRGPWTVFGPKGEWVLGD